MRIFIIPSWYPSSSNPIYGIFNYEQARLMSQERPDWSIGVSKWGQGNEPFLLRATDPRSILKRLARHEDSESEIYPNLKEYFSGAFTWTQKFQGGNIDGMIKANDRNLQRFISDYGKPDIISAQTTYPAALIARALSEKYEIPYTVTLRMSPFPFPQYLVGDSDLKPMIKDPLTNASRLIATSNSLKARAESFGFGHVTTINNPVDTSFFVPGLLEKSKLVTALAVGRTEEQKGFDMLLEAIAGIPKLKLRIGGEGRLMREYQTLATKFGVENRVEWLGDLTRNQVLREMQNCSFYVLSSRHETFGNVVLEAMACGKPVVATKCGGPTEIVKEETGYLCEIEVRDLTDKINMMMENLDSFSRDRIRRYVEVNYSPVTWIEKLERVFKSVMSS